MLPLRANVGGPSSAEGAELGAAFPIIGVGGIIDAEHARASLRAGATLLQIYTGFAYRGAALLEEILQGLAA